MFCNLKLSGHVLCIPVPWYVTSSFYKLGLLGSIVVECTDKTTLTLVIYSVPGWSFECPCCLLYLQAYMHGEM